MTPSSLRRIFRALRRRGYNLTPSSVSPARSFWINSNLVTQAIASRGWFAAGVGKLRTLNAVLIVLKLKV